MRLGEENLLTLLQLKTLKQCVTTSVHCLMVHKFNPCVSEGGWGVTTEVKQNLFE